MEHDKETGRIVPANDNDGAGEPSAEGPSAETWRKVDAVALKLARIIGRSMAREDFERLQAANDDRPDHSASTEDGADKE